MDGARRASNNNYHHDNRRPPRDSYHRGSYYRGRYKYNPHRKYNRNDRPNARNPNKHEKRVPLRPASPIEGSEEYMTRKIEHTSAIIMRHLLSPNETITVHTKFNNGDEQAVLSKVPVTKQNTNQFSDKTDKVGDKSVTRTKKNSAMSLSAKEIHEKIMNHITNLNNGRKRNFINANSSTGLDNAINHMQKQKRLEISRILRDMNSTSEFQGASNYKNSIVPDIGIQINELPVDVIEELRQTLNLDLELLNEVIADSSDYENRSEEVTSSSGELDMAINSIQVKSELIDSENRDPQNSGIADAVEIKSEDISDLFEEIAPVALPVADGPEAMHSENSKSDDLAPSSYSLCIKDEPEPSNSNISSGLISTFSNSTVVFPNAMNQNADFENIVVETPKNGEFNRHSPEIFENDSEDLTLRFIETTIRHFVKKENHHQCKETDTTLLDQIDLIDLCVKHLTSYKRSLIQSLVTSCRGNNLNQNREKTGMSQCSKSSHTKSLVTRSSQTLDFAQIDENDKRVIKKRKIDVSEQSKNCQDDCGSNIQIKIEENNDTLNDQNILRFDTVQERIMVIEKVDNELILATETGNIIFASLQNGTIQHRLDVTSCTITSMAFVRGISDFIYMYVGSLEEVLRVYDFRKRELTKASHIDDQIRCMDAMWDYVFMGCKNGTLIRYSCKKDKIEVEEKNTGTDILVLKAAQEGPRRVLIIGHRNAPIYVRDAMSGLYLRNFSNEAVTPTVYSLLINSNSLYCGTAKDNILVYSFQEGNLIQKIIAGESKGISCMKVRKNHLFAGCYNGSIYVYNLDIRKLVAILKGPGGSIICMEVLSNQVIVGTITRQLESVILPSDIFMQ